MPLRDRSLEIDPSSGDLIYPVKDCEKKWWGHDCEKKVLRWDLRDPVKRKELIDAGFHCVSRSRFK